MDELQKGLLRRLAPGGWVSGAALAADHALSREAISKRVEKLADWGLNIQRQAGRGYRLSEPLELLDANALTAALSPPCAVELHDSIDSTNRRAMEAERAPLLVLAEHQQAGRGRRGRNWHSPFGQNLYLSLRWDLTHWPERLPALSLAVGVILAETLAGHGVPVSLKWPNDLHLNGAKLGGLLIEQRGEAHGACRLVIGLGLNVAMRDGPNLGQAWTSLAREGFSISRQDLAIELVGQLSQLLGQLDDQSIAETLQRYARFDQWRHKAVRVVMPDGTLAGEHQGIDDWGRLRLATARGIELISAGDLSLRRETDA